MQRVRSYGVLFNNEKNHGNLFHETELPCVGLVSIPESCTAWDSSP